MGQRIVRQGRAMGVTRMYLLYTCMKLSMIELIKEKNSDQTVKQGWFCGYECLLCKQEHLS